MAPFFLYQNGVTEKKWEDHDLFSYLSVAQPRVIYLKDYLPCSESSKYICAQIQSNPDLATVKIATNLDLPTKKILDDQLFTNKKPSK